MRQGAWEGIMSEEGRYNGWKNYETWNVNLWAMNEEGLYHTVMAGKPYTAESAEDLAYELFPAGTPDMHDKVQRMARVDWQAIADAWNE